MSDKVRELAETIYNEFPGVDAIERIIRADLAPFLEAAEVIRQHVDRGGDHIHCNGVKRLAAEVQHWVKPLKP